MYFLIIYITFFYQYNKIFQIKMNSFKTSNNNLKRLLFLGKKKEKKGKAEEEERRMLFISTLTAQHEIDALIRVRVTICSTLYKSTSDLCLIIEKKISTNILALINNTHQKPSKLRLQNSLLFRKLASYLMT